MSLPCGAATPKSLEPPRCGFAPRPSTCLSRTSRRRTRSPKRSNRGLAPGVSRPAYHVLSVDIRGPENPPGQPAAGWAWFRLKLPLLAGEEPTPFQRVCAAADFPNGISYLVDPRRTSLSTRT